MSTLLPDPLQLSAHQAEHLGSFKRAQLLPGAGSERRYWRLFRQDQSTVLLMYHGAEREENLAFAPLTHWLLSHERRVPQILAEHQETQGALLGSGWIWLEDFGSQDLLSLATAANNAPTAKTEQRLHQAYQNTLSELAHWHQLKLSTLPPSAAERLQGDFDLSLYEWEQEYFWEHAIGRLSSQSLSEQASARERSQSWLAELAEKLSQLPRVVMHRDFQSTNVMVLPHKSSAENKATHKPGLEIGIIDYQGLRRGLAEYDLASLLLDPYTHLPETLKTSALTHYAEQSGQSLERLQEAITEAGIQRLMQALGAYAKLGLKERKTRFLPYIKPARQRLHTLLETAQAPPALKQILQSVQDATRFTNL